MATAAQIRAFIERLGALAVAESNRRIAAGKGFVLPSVCIAQSALETGWGTSGLMTRANAYFGIKAGGSWTGAVYTADTWEVANGEAYNTSANFRAYDSLEASVADYYDLIGNASRYKNALSFGTDKSAWKTPNACITAIWSGGYATDTLYVEKIMSTINARSLTDYDTLVDGTDTAPISTPSIIFELDDLVQGKLITADSGRSITNDKTFLDCIAVDWDKAREISAETTLYAPALPDGATFYFCYTTDTSAVVDDVYTGGEPIKLLAGTKVGFYIRFAEETLIEDFKLTSDLGFMSGLPAGSESYSGVLAHFVKIT